jgi:ribosomal protein L11 methyltransferase
LSIEYDPQVTRAAAPAGAVLALAWLTNGVDMITHRLSLLVPESRADEARGTFYAAGFGTVLVQEPGDLGTESDPVPDAHVRFVAFLESRDPPELAALRARLDGRAPIRIDPFEDRDWLTTFRAHHRAVRIGRGLVVAPPWSRVKARRGRILLRIDPGLAFGTGSHASTYLCLRALCDRARRGPLGRVLDVGTGSGVLAFAALRLGATHARGIEPDPDALEAARANARLNGLSRARGLVLTPEAAERARGSFDLVLANLVRDLLLQTAPVLSKRVAPGGALIVAGLLDDQASDVCAALEAQGLSLVRHRRREGWSALELERPRRSRA